MIKIIDNFLSEEDFNIVSNYCINAVYKWGEADRKDTAPLGMVNQILKFERTYKIFESKTIDLAPDLFLYRMYVNCFAPTEQPYFHVDSFSKGITFLYYPNKFWDIDDMGETQFMVDNEIYGVTPIPNRMVYFDATIKHRATSFRNKHRFTVAIKYGEKNGIK